MTYYITETKLEIAVAASYHRKHIAYEIHRRMTIVQSIIKDNDKDTSRTPEGRYAINR